ncbi:ADP-dependent (S)-NAD(P)H-hydrate dehydratase [Candidatus Nitrotoga sp. HW29]|uniref:NAD(P)H-hydrate dehydratase n=1 Tax=Candidatus Nitrotoga sp. HW29 TaxID=2886963 RepID=UPI001EF1BE47|nr:NAD(P)H-hydrate dehydratase [Candidatus Nitrotoga sp. HW29]CAH1904761.1 ADP-dependent (S)-NAD(P)H-hydrate dehydratase [Candidatus Nitrotoga sp. HW29]
MPVAPHIPTITQKQVATFLSPRPRDSHKGKFGTVAVIGGANGMVGAPLLAARAALKLGAGSVHVGMLADNAPSVDILQAELMLHSAQTALRLPKLDVLAIGCGLGYDNTAQKILQDALKLDTVLVFDADALNILALRPNLRTALISRKNANVITPHPGEAARLLGCNTEEVQAARAEAAQELAKRFHSVVVLKGAHSLCVTRDGKIALNKTGNPGMSSPGMGDVLTGMIAAFIAQGLNVDQALLLAVHLHGAAGDAIAKQKITIGMTATDVTEWARWLLNQWIA